MTTGVLITLILCGTALTGWAIMWYSICQMNKDDQNRKDDN